MKLLFKIGLILFLVHMTGQGMAMAASPEDESRMAYVSEEEACLGDEEGGTEKFSCDSGVYGQQGSLNHVVNVEEVLSVKSRWFSHQLRLAQRMMMYFRNGFSIVLQKERERRFPSVKFHHVFPPCEFYVFTLRKILV